MLQHNREGAAELLAALDNALQQVGNCRHCNTFCEGDECPICADEKRDPTRLMIVHMPADVAALGVEMVGVVVVAAFNVLRVGGFGFHGGKLDVFGG